MITNLKRAASVIVIMGAALTLSACSSSRTWGISMVTGSGQPVTRNVEAAGFTAVNVQGGFKVDVSSGEAYSVVVTADDNLFDYMRIAPSGTTLKIELLPGHSYDFKGHTPYVSVTMPALSAISTQGGSVVNLDGFSSPNGLQISSAGGSRLTGNVEAGDVTMNTFGGGAVTLRGKANSLVVDSTGGVVMDLGQFVVDRANITSKGGSAVTVNAVSTLDYDLLGGARLIYRGSPAIGHSQVMGGASVSR